MKDIKDICISECFPFSWIKKMNKEIDYTQLRYIGKKRVRHRRGKKIYYCDEYVYWYPKVLFGIFINEGEYYRSTEFINLKKDDNVIELYSEYYNCMC